MEKLIELLNEYEKEKYEKEIKSSSYYWGISNGKLECSVGGTDHDLYDDEIAMVIKSKEFGFIKWLVENDKININEEWNDYEKTNLYCNSDFFQLQKHYSYYESLLMLLAIQDEPIRFLCEMLK